ncbi:MAG TPA: hypothetical protein VHQ01_02530 [Pyrinomonadaceae bacterium]|nr:hypothetical protein [Pyrinomonadaceae bacterium]
MENIHSTSADMDTNGVPWEERPWVKNFKMAFSVARWVVITAVLGFGIYMTQRDTNAQQSINVADVKRELVETQRQVAENKLRTEEQIQAIDKKMLTRELYEAYRMADVERMARIEKSIEMIASRP